VTPSAPGIVKDLVLIRSVPVPIATLDDLNRILGSVTVSAAAARVPGLLITACVYAACARLCCLVIEAFQSATPGGVSGLRLEAPVTAMPGQAGLTTGTSVQVTPACIGPFLSDTLAGVPSLVMDVLLTTMLGRASGLMIEASVPTAPSHVVGSLSATATSVPGLVFDTGVPATPAAVSAGLGLDERCLIATYQHKYARHHRQKDSPHDELP
jgi:hypothetical protein